MVAPWGTLWETSSPCSLLAEMGKMNLRKGGVDVVNMPEAIENTQGFKK